MTARLRDRFDSPVQVAGDPVKVCQEAEAEANPQIAVRQRSRNFDVAPAVLNALVETMKVLVRDCNLVKVLGNCREIARLAVPQGPGVYPAVRQLYAPALKLLASDGLFPRQAFGHD